MSGRVLSPARGSDRLAVRRRLRRRRIRIALGILFLLVCTGIVYELRQSTVRISDVLILGADQSFAKIARSAMQGSYLGIIPRDSIFFFPASRIRADIVAEHPDIAAVSISRDGFSSISIKVDNRVPIARWCGSSPTSTQPENSPGEEVMQTTSGDCYLFDASGFVYATATRMRDVSSGNSESNPDKTLTPFLLFSLLKPDAISRIGATLKDSNYIPVIFDFARRLASFGPSIGAVVIRADEVDFYFATTTQSVIAGPRITYLLGDEQNAFTALVSAKGQANLFDPTLKYVDVRFPGKIYLKRAEPLK
jgi:hypothetical protein